MKLLNILENRVYVDGDLLARAGKISVLVDPSAKAIVHELDIINKNNNTHSDLGCWLYDDCLYVWDREDADHNTIAKQLGIKNNKSIAFYINSHFKEQLFNDDWVVVEAVIVLSDFSGRQDYNNNKMVLSNPVINDVLKIINSRSKSYIS